MTLYPLLINGQRVDTGQHDAVLDPADLSLVGLASRAGATEVARAVQAAQQAFGAWAADEAARRKVLSEAAERLEPAAETLALLVAREQGRPLKLCRGEIAGAIATLRQHAGLALPATQQLSAQVQIQYRPQGVVAAITPWNVPIILLILKIAPALLAGNTLVVKPSEHTPLSTLYLGELLQPVFPAGVLNVIAGGPEVGQWLCQAPEVRHISFTGSIATGEQLVHASARDFKRLTLELGGNDAALVLEDADIARIAPRLFWGAFFNAGQVCFAIKRLYVHRSRFEELVQALTALALRTRVGPALDEQSELGPLTTAQQLARVKALVEDARARGGQVHCGGEPLPGPGYFYPPTLVSGVGPGVALVDEEQFGPVLPIIAFDDEAGAIAQANATRYGLGASVWSRDLDRARAIAGQLQAGLVWINQHMVIHPGAPKGGQKSSGLGYEGGRAGLEQFLQQTVINLAGDAA